MPCRSWPCCCTAGTAAADLPAYHGNAQHTGYSTALGPQSPVLKWRLDLSGEVISSPVVGPDGTIYLGSVIEDTRHPAHFVTAVNPDGTIKWRFGTGWWDTQTQSSPALGADGRIYVGAQDGYFYALNPDGTLAWRFAATRPVQQHPVVGNDGTVYVGLDGVLHAFDPDGTVRWTASLGTTSLPGGPALSPDGQTIYAFGHDEAGPVATLYAFRPDGTIRWQYSNFYAYYPALSPPTVAADGTVIVLSGQVVAIGPDGVQRWRYSPSASYYNSYASLSVNPAGEVVFAFSWYLGKLNAAGTELWQIDFLGGDFVNELESTYSAPLIDANGNIYLGLGTGKRWTRPWGKVLRVLLARRQAELGVPGRRGRLHFVARARSGRHAVRRLDGRRAVRDPGPAGDAAERDHRPRVRARHHRRRPGAGQRHPARPRRRRWSDGDHRAAAFESRRPRPSRFRRR